MLANAVGQTTSVPQQNRLRGQARSYSRSGQRRQPSVNAKSVGAGLLGNAVDQTTSAPQQIAYAGKRAPTAGPGNVGNLR